MVCFFSNRKCVKQFIVCFWRAFIFYISTTIFMEFFFQRESVKHLSHSDVHLMEDVFQFNIYVTELQIVLMDMMKTHDFAQQVLQSLLLNAPNYLLGCVIQKRYSRYYYNHKKKYTYVHICIIFGFTIHIILFEKYVLCDNGVVLLQLEFKFWRYSGSSLFTWILCQWQFSCIGAVHKLRHLIFEI